MDIRTILKKLSEEIRLADESDDSLQLGSFYMTDTKQELIDGLDKLILGDSIGLIDTDYEYTVTLEDENSYSFLKDANWLDNDVSILTPQWQDLTKEEVIELIDIEVK